MPGPGGPGGPRPGGPGPRGPRPGGPGPRGPRPRHRGRGPGCGGCFFSFLFMVGMGVLLMSGIICAIV